MKNAGVPVEASVEAMARRPHPGDHDAPLRVENHPVRAQERFAQACLQRADGIGLDVEHAPRELEEVLGVGELMGL
jgi:hypothetical protein